jgi:hypothetical protein
MAFATVNAYELDPAAPGFKGAVAGTGETDISAKITGLSIQEPLNPPYILEITADDDTVDITTGKFPVITVMRTLMTEEMLTSGKPIYGTPITSLVINLAILNADSTKPPYVGNGDGMVTNAEVEAALAAASAQVKSTLGFGLQSQLNIFTTPPLINPDTSTSEQQAKVAAYRSAVEALTAIIYQMNQLAGDTGVTTDDILTDLARDLADGVIDGVANGVAIESYQQAALDVLEQDPATLPIPNDPEGRTVADVNEIVTSETAETGNEEVDTTEYQQSGEEVVLEPAETSDDKDGDGVLNNDDAFPDDASADTDSDGDGMPDVAYIVVDGERTEDIDTEASDKDDDNDGVKDVNDDFPLNPEEHTDTDGDGIGNNEDTDDDGDDVPDTEDDFPLDGTKSNASDVDEDGWPSDQDPDDGDPQNPGTTFVDTDGDGIGNDTDEDDDNDGAKDGDDDFPLDPTETTDTDGDGTGDNTDPDIDGDGALNEADRFPRNPNESVDTDNDGIGNNADLDDDNDGLTDEEEADKGTDPLKRDTDGDGVFDKADAKPLDPTEQFDTDKDGIGNNRDNCPLTPNFHQVDTDFDGFGNACDTDDDGDGVPDTEDAYPLDPTRSEPSGDADEDGWPTDEDPDDNDPTNPGTEYVDTDGDGVGDTNDDDDDNDGVPDGEDLFPLDETEWSDMDGDGIGDNSDPDRDGDGVANDTDAFPSDPSEQIDTDFDGIGNNADPDDDNDGVLDDDDDFPLDPNESSDIDGDGIGDNADPDRDGDGVANEADLFPNDPNEWSDMDGDGIGDNSDPDRDGDGVANEEDDFPDDATEWVDTDGDGTGNNTDEDDDGDGVVDTEDGDPLDDTNRYGGLADAFWNGGVGMLDSEREDRGDESTADMASHVQVNEADGTGEMPIYEFAYELIQYNRDSEETTFEEYVYDADTETFVLDTETDSDFHYVLTDNGWMQSDEDWYLTSMNTDGSVNFENSQGFQVHIDGATTDLSGMNIAETLQSYGSEEMHLWWLNVDPEAIFAEGALSYEMDFNRLTEEYELHVNADCNAEDSLGGFCYFTHVSNLQTGNPRNALSSLDDLFVSQAWDGVDPSQLYAVWAAGGYNVSLQAELLAGDGATGAINFYKNHWYDNEHQIQKFAIQGTWTRFEKNGEDIVLFEIPDAIMNMADFELRRDESWRLHSVLGGYVRDGSYAPISSNDSDDGSMMLNLVAMDNVVQNFMIVDSDGDGIPDIEDEDADNDGYPNDEDAFPRDPSEWMDTDGDGIGNNADTDDDGDGVADTDDLAPLDDGVGAAMTFTAANLAETYVSIIAGQIEDPTISVAHQHGETFDFMSTTGTFADRFGGGSFSYSLTDNVLTFVPNTTEPDVEIDWPSVSQLIEMGAVSAELGEAFIEAHGNYQVQVSLNFISQTWQLLEDGVEVDRFWEVSTDDYQIVDDWEREQLFGSIDAAAVTVDSMGYAKSLRDMSTMTMIPFTAEDVVGDWALPLTFEPGHENESLKFHANLGMFDTDGTGSLMMSGRTFAWMLDDDGALIVTMDDTSHVIKIALFESYGTGYGVYASTNDGDEPYAIYALGSKVSGSHDLTAFNDQFLMSSFTITNPYYWDGGELDPQGVFGFRHETGGETTRIWHGDYNLNNQFDGWDRWFWDIQDDGVFTIRAMVDENGNAYSDCDPAGDDCNPWRLRYWKPLVQTANRIYVLEWEEMNDNAWTFPSDVVVESPRIPARVNFYELYPLDDDHDGIPNGEDLDSDNDGINDDEDAFPSDPYEWSDNDGDGIGDNADHDDDNDGVNDNEDDLPLDGSETVDTDGDGIGNNTDTDDDGDGVADTDDLDPLDDQVSSPLPFTAENLATDYIQIVDGRLDNPTIRMGQGSGASYNFGEGAGTYADSQSGGMFDYTIANDELTLYPASSPESVSWLTVESLIEMGIVSEANGDAYILEFGNVQIETLITTVSESWLLLMDGTDTDKFWKTSTNGYYIVGDFEREQLMGSIDAGAVQTESEGNMLVLEDLSMMTPMMMSDVDIIGTWALPVAFDPNNEQPNMRLFDDVAMFADDGTGSVMMSGRTFEWMVNTTDGSLSITMDDTMDVLTYVQYEDYENGIGLHTTSSDGQQYFSRYGLAIKMMDGASAEPFMNQFMMSSFMLTNPDGFNDNGLIDPDNFFGFRLEDSGMVTRVWSGNYDLTSDRNGWDRWFVDIADDGLVTLTAMNHQYDGTYADCDPSELECNRWRVRYWKPMQTTDNRLYVLEWEEWNDYAWNFDGTPEMLVPGFDARVNFYETFAIDSDNDGWTDDLDADDDNDGVNDAEDAYPLDPYESKDTDGDGIGNNADDDDDNDGVNDWDDAFPEDATESEDHDGDGIGNNADDDDDNDGVADADDLDPFDDSVGQAIMFTADNLAASYVEITEGHIDDPSYATGFRSGVTYSFDVNSGVRAHIHGGGAFNYTLVGDMLSMVPVEPLSSISWLLVSSLADMGVITPEAAEAYIVNNGDLQIEMEVATSQMDWLLLEDGDTADRFWQINTSAYQVVNDSDREQLFGSIDAPAVEVEGESHAAEYQELDMISTIPMLETDVVGNWALPLLVDPTSENEELMFNDSVGTFNTDGTGFEMMTQATFTWVLDADGALVVTYDTSGYQIMFEQFEQYSASSAIYSTSDAGGMSFAKFSLGVKLEDGASVEPFIDQFMMSGFTMTNPQYYDDTGELYKDAYFGFRLTSNGLVQRVVNGNFDFSNHRSGWDRWFHEVDDTGKVTLTSYYSEYDGPYADCDPAMGDCNRFRVRHWKPLVTTDNRVYVLEWSEINDNAWVFDGSPEAFRPLIAPRINFYQLYYLDSDHDGVTDDMDNDDDNDGVNDSDDSFPYDPYEQYDTDGDGIGNNMDDDDDNDGVKDWDDAFPEDASESGDHDGDGVGNNADADDDNDGVDDVDDLDPYNDMIGAPMPFAVDQLADKYTLMMDGALDDPSMRMGMMLGTTYTFNVDESGMLSDQDGSGDFTWAFGVNSMTMTPVMTEMHMQHYAVSQMAEMGIIDMTSAEDFINANGDQWLELEVTLQDQTWQMLEDGAIEDAFWLVDTNSYNFVDTAMRETFFGSVDAPAVEVADFGREIVLTDMSALTPMPLVETDMHGEWSIRLGIEELMDGIAFASDHVTFNTDNTATGAVFGHSYTWSVDVDGNLVVSLPALGADFVLTQYESFGTGVGMYTTMTHGGETYTSYDLTVTMAGSVDIGLIQDLFVVNGFSLTDPQNYDEDGLFNYSNLFGYKLNSDGIANRITSANYNFETGDGMDTWTWTQDMNGVVSIMSYQNSVGDYYPICDADADTECNRSRERRWLPLQQVGNRIYVLEWEMMNEAVWTYPSQTEDWRFRIHPRVNFYEVLELNP